MLRSVLAVLLFFGHGIIATTDRPNIVFIVADDMGWHDTGFNGGDVKTPNLDALAAQSVIISRHYTLPSCTPSRTALMTGRYPIRTGLQSKPLPAGVPVSLPLSEKLFPEYFHHLGYKNHLVGKWHLGYQTPSHLPMRRGFDTFFGYLNGYISYYDGTHSQSGVNGRDVRRNEEGAALDVYGKYFTNVLSEEAVSVIKEHPDRGGLLLFLNHAAPHTGNLAFPRESPPGLPANASHRQILREMVRHLDNSVGDVVAALNNKGMLNNTIIVFLSDNGAPTVDEQFHYENHGSNWPLRGVKISNRDGGVRTPSFIWTSMLKGKARVSQQLFHVTDWLPTLFTAAGGKLSEISGSTAIDGIDQWDSLISSAPPPRTELLLDINDLTQSESYILNNWKLIKDTPPQMSTAFATKYYGESGDSFVYDEIEVELCRVARILPQPQVTYAEVRKRTALKKRCNTTEKAVKMDCHSRYCLYDLLQDPSECTDLASSHPDVVQLLAGRLDDFRKLVVPTANCSYDPRADPKNWDDYWSPWMEDDSASGAGSTSFVTKFFVLLLTVNILSNVFS
ncbi:arylsulfatase B isoform X2 [Halyomorpha halys]|uniref:arylsulfatase B isoform X2 n=1 Tax=Halyomorpha halys TaxID=286706 RepID=UPI0006D4F28B|nr:arylsulfatase B-like isoform X2 [Halyomorpha halys]